MWGIGALAHDYGFGLAWVMLSTVLVWAGPAQVIMISALGTGAPLFEVALAVFLSGVRFLPMVVTLLPLLRGPRTKVRDLFVAAHFTSASTWVESFRLLPPLPQDAAFPFCNGLAIGFMLSGHIGSVIGFYLAASLPALLTAVLLFLTPISFSALDRSEQHHAGQPAGTGVGLVVSRCSSIFRSDSTLCGPADRGLGGLCGTSATRGAKMNELSPYLVLLLVGFLPNEIWRVLGVWIGGGHGRGLRIYRVGARGCGRGAGRCDREADVRPAGALAVAPLAVRLVALGGGCPDIPDRAALGVRWPGGRRASCSLLAGLLFPA
jgi:predicted branched-subunit amino acid permease